MRTSSRGTGGLIQIFPMGKHYKVAMSVHCHNSVASLIGPYMLLGCKTPTTNQILVGPIKCHRNTLRMPSLNTGRLSARSSPPTHKWVSKVHAGGRWGSMPPGPPGTYTHKKWLPPSEAVVHSGPINPNSERDVAPAGFAPLPGCLSASEGGQH